MLSRYKKGLATACVVGVPLTPYLKPSYIRIASNTSKMPSPQLKVAVAGLGRMGKRHALNFFQSVPRAELVAVSSPDADERSWASTFFHASGVTIYENYNEMLLHEGLEAVCIASVTAVHASQAIAALEAGKHVLCEKPLATTAEVVTYLQPPYRSPLTLLHSLKRSSMQRPNVQTSKSCAGFHDGLTRTIVMHMPR